MTIKQLIEELQALADDPASGVTLDSTVRVPTEAGDSEVNFAYVWPLASAPYVTFETEGDSREQVAAVIRQALANRDERDRIEALLRDAGGDYPLAASRLGMRIEDFNLVVRKYGL